MGMETVDKLNLLLSGPVNDVLGITTMKDNVKRVQCKNGVSLSVQASKYHYCTPREDSGPYSDVEVGFPSVPPPESWSEYFDGDWVAGDRTDSVYGYIPIEMVAEFIDDNGGIKED